MTTSAASPRSEAIAHTLLYEHRLAGLGRAFAAVGLAPVIVKGQSVADLVYPAEEPRIASDVDLLVGSDEDAVVGCLKAIGYLEKIAADRPYSREFSGERPFVTEDPALPPLVEVHRCLDKIIRRPIDYPTIIARSRPATRAGFRYPTIEDLLLLVVLHASNSAVPDPKNPIDIRHLVERGRPNMVVVRERAAAWGLTRAINALAGSAESRKNASNIVTRGVPRAISAWSFLPVPLRYVVGQLDWHDSPSLWARDLTRYAWARLRDHL